jgi:transposase InsO family protein
MKEWLTAAEISAEALPDLPGTERGVQAYALREGWNGCLAYCRDRKGRGGGFEYHVSLFPALARLEYERRHRQIEVLPAPTPAPMVLGEGLTDRAARERDARLAILGACEAFSKGQRLGAASCLQIFVDRYNLRSIPVEDWILDLVPQLSKRTLARWRSAKFMGRADRLAHDPALSRQGKGVLETADGGRVRTFVLALVAHQPLLSATHVRDLCRSQFGERLQVRGRSVEMPPVRTFQHFLKVLRETQTVALTRLSDPDRYRSTMAPSGVGTYRWVKEPNALWMIDASPVDALCVDGRHAIYACIDIATRRTILYLSRTPRAAAVRMLIRKAILAWGMPAKIKTDNGSDFVAYSTKRLFDSLGIEMELSTAYTPQQKGHVERVIGTFQHDCARLLPGFIGHSVADRKRIEDRKGFAERLHEETADAFGVSLDGATLQGHADAWIEISYQHHAHAGLGGISPFQAATASSAPVRTVDPRALDILLMPIVGKDGVRTVTKFGVRIDGHHYVINAALPGDRVLIRMDPMDVGRALAFDADDGRWIGEAICPELRGVSAAEVLAAKREITSERLATATKDVRKTIKEIVQGPALIERVLEVRARDIPNVIALPKREEVHSTPAIAAALDAGRPAEIAPLSERAAALHAELTRAAPIAAEAQDKVRPLRTQETRQQRFRRALDLEARRAAGEPLAEEEAFWLGSYSAGSEYRAMRTLYEDGGEQVLR